jgi:signal transduction histidine kinase
LRQGQLTTPSNAYLARWETELEARITAGPWHLAGTADPKLAWQTLKATGEVAVHSLILEGRRVAGAISLVFSPERQLTPDVRASLAQPLQIVGSLISLVGELALSKQRLSQLSLFYQLAQVTASTFDLDKVLNNILELAAAILDASACLLFMIDIETDELILVRVHGDAGAFQLQRRRAMGEGLAGWVASEGEPLLISDLPNDPRFDPSHDACLGWSPQSGVAVPVQMRDKTIGVLAAFDRRSNDSFDAEDLSLMVTTGHQAAIAIENHQLYQSLREEQQRIIQAQENVRRQVARNLHDGTVQYLSALSMGIDHLDQLLQHKPNEARAEIAELRLLTQQATRQARLALFELRPLILESQGLVPALEAYTEQLRDGQELSIHLQADPALPDLDSSIASTVFFIVQEAVTNAKKHAAPCDVSLFLSQEDGWLQVLVEDNGRGFDSETVEQEYDRMGSIGLLNMRERAALINGHVEIQSSTGSGQAGTRVILRVPLSEEANKVTPRQEH